MRFARRLLVLGACALMAAAALATQPISRENLGWWAARHRAKLQEVRAEKFDLVFLGDSITQRWETPPYQPAWRLYYGDRKALNLGFIGDATSHLLWRIEHGELDGQHPKAVVLLIGANNLGRLHWPAADDVAGIEAVVTATREKLPGANILLLGVLPSDRGPWVAAQHDAINRALAARYGSGGTGLRYLDLSPLFLRPDGSVDTSQFADASPDPALHPSPAAARRMAEAIEPILAAVLGDRRHGG